VPAPAEDGLRTLRADRAELESIRDGLGETHVRLETLARHVRKLEHARELVTHLEEELRTPRTRGAAVDRLPELAEELRKLLGEQERALPGGIEALDRELLQLHETTERMQLIPLSSLFDLLERAARDTARAQGKRVLFAARGGEVRVESRALDALHSALIQLVRNAVAHGIEPQSERMQRGKDPVGSVHLEISRSGARVRIDCSDDGRGIDFDAVRRALLKSGAPAQDVEQLDAEQLTERLLGGGISTAQVLTEVSGRGVGLDVVREIAQRLGGTVSMRTTMQGGTRFTLDVPLSLTSFEGLVLESSGRRVSIPLTAVQSGARIARSDILRTPEGPALTLGDRVIPFVTLQQLLEPDCETDEAAHLSAVILKGAAGTAAIGVDRLLGTATVALRALPPLAPGARFVAGVSSGRGGMPDLVLDPEELIAHAQRSAAPRHSAARTRPPILVIDDSLTTRMLEQSILEAAGYEVDMASSAEEGLEVARRRCYGLFLVDVEMPGMDGFTFIARTRADPELRSVPAILVSSRAGPEERARGQQVGAFAYIDKGEFHQEELLAHIRRCLA
jgi:two-component system, chemotaxis family, sensor kinase CheA